MSVETDRIRQAVNVITLYAELFPGLSRGKTARCFRDDAHANRDKSPSVQLHRDGFHCHGCGTRLDAFGLVMSAKRCDFRQALAWLADRAGVDLQPTQRLESPWAWPDPTPPQIAFLYRLHELLAQVQPTPAMRQWLTSRGVGVDVAWALGCRDWQPVRNEILALIESQPQIAASLRLLHDGKLWWPMRGPSFIPGVVVPAFVPRLAVPVQWRWRFCEPVEVNGKRLKTAAMPGAQPIPLGVHAPDRTGTVAGASSCRILVVAEGEPDWLSFHDAAAGCVGVLGICDVSGGWRSAWSTLLRDPQLVVVATHAKPGDPFGKAVGAAMDAAHGRAAAQRRLVRVRFDEDNDANDNHKRGKLLPLIARILKEKLPQ